ncbi:hypothetical protein VTN00DRAFT_1795 [Thermoascus crustaceus]|uniref:uncharacterized protein n=1 Tax=Thermoascus crustaceus TaxID=5088 RepID=UPI003743E953
MPNVEERKNTRTSAKENSCHHHVYEVPTVFSPIVSIGSRTGKRTFKPHTPAWTIEETPHIAYTYPYTRVHVYHHNACTPDTRWKKKWKQYSETSCQNGERWRVVGPPATTATTTDTNHAA